MELTIPANSRYVLFLCTPAEGDQMKVETRFDETTTSALAAAELVNLGSPDIMRQAEAQMRQVARMQLVQPISQPEPAAEEAAPAVIEKAAAKNGAKE